MIQTVENIGEKLISMLTYDASQPLIFSSGLFLFLFAGFLLSLIHISEPTRP